MKAFFHQKVILKSIAVELYAYTSIQNKKVPILPMSCVMLLLSVCLRLSDDKFRENNAIICPASYSYYSTNHNDGVEDYFNQTGNGQF